MPQYGAARTGSASWWVRWNHALLVIAIVQGILLAGLLILIVLNRWFRVRRRARVHPLRQACDAVFKRWTEGSATTAAVLETLERLPVPVRLDCLGAWAGLTPPPLWQDLSRAVERRWWAQLVRHNVKSVRWWKRLEAARLLALVPTPSDTARVRQLLADRHPAVHLIVVGALDRLPDASLALAALRRVPDLPRTAQVFYASRLRSSRPLIVEQLIRMLGDSADRRLAGLAEFAGHLREPALREAFLRLATHADAEVRVQAARALSTYPHPDSTTALRALAADPDWPVRALAVQGLGRFVETANLPLLRACLRDAEWWVRLRAALSLTRFGEAGRDALTAEQGGPHPEARNVARFVLGFSGGELREYGG